MAEWEGELQWGLSGGIRLHRAALLSRWSRSAEVKIHGAKSFWIIVTRLPSDAHVSRSNSEPALKLTGPFWVLVELELSISNLMEKERKRKSSMKRRWFFILHFAGSIYCVCSFCSVDNWPDVGFVISCPDIFSTSDKILKAENYLAISNICLI